MPTLLMLPPQTPTTRQWAKRLATAVPELTVIVAEDAGEAAAKISEADAAYGTLPREFIPRAGRLRWLQAPRGAHVQAQMLQATVVGHYGPVYGVVFVLITVGHLRVRAETGARVSLLVLAIVTAGGVFVTFVFTTLIHEPGTALAMGVILLLSIALDATWKHRRGLQPAGA